MDTSNKVLFTQKEAAKFLGIGYSTIRLYIQKGKIKYVTVGKRKLIPTSYLQQIIN